MTVMKLHNLIQVWRLSEKSNIFPPIATEQELELAESKLGFQLPVPLRDLYRLCNGIYLLNGNLHPDMGAVIPGSGGLRKAR